MPFFRGVADCQKRPDTATKFCLAAEAPTFPALALALALSFLWLFLAFPTWSAAAAATGGGDEAAKASDVIFFVQILVLLLVGRLLGETMRRFGQPEVMGQLLAGLLIGPSVLGTLAPEWQHMLFPRSPEQKAMIDAVSQLGVLMLLLLTGMETDLKLLRHCGRASFTASVAGIVVPFSIGFVTGEYLPEWLLPDPGQRLVTSLFLGTALSISSVKIVAMVVREMNFMRRTLGQVIVSSAIIDDTLGWIIIAIIFGLALHGQVDALNVAQSVIGTLVFLALSLTVGRRLVFQVIKWTNDNFLSDFAVVTAILCIMCLMALITHLIGVHTVLGAFVAGILVGQSPLLSEHIERQLRGLIAALFMPIFFGMAGLSADLTVLTDPAILGLTVALILIASVGKFTGAFIGAELGGLTRREGFALALGMNARGSTEVIVATIGLSIGALNQTLFTMIVTMAVLTTLAMPPTLRWALRRIPISKAERERLTREEYEADGFVANLERLLIAADTSANGSFAARLAGILAGSRGMPTTVLQFAASQRGGNGGPNEAKNVGRLDEAVRAGVALSQSLKPRKEAQEAEPDAVDLRTLTPENPVPQSVAEEAKKGYGLLVVGLEKIVGRRNGFHETLDAIAEEFTGPLAIVDARTPHRDDPHDAPLDILVPVTGTQASRNAAEVAFTLARATEAPVKILYVAQRGKKGRKDRQKGRQSVRLRRDERAILDAVVALAQTFAITVETAAIADLAADSSIVEMAGTEGHNLIVLGVTRRTSPHLFFGNTAAGVIANAKASLLFVAAETTNATAQSKA